MTSRDSAGLPLYRRIGLFGAIALQWWLLLDGSWYRSLWVDEAYSLEQASKSLPELILTVAPDHTPLYYLGLSAGIALFGHSEFALRFFSAAAVLAGAAAVFWLGRRTQGPVSGYVAAALWAVSPFLWYYGREARPHGLAATMVVISLGFLLRACSTLRVRDWICFAIAGLVSVLTFYYAALPIFSAAVAALVLNVRRPALIRPLVTSTAAITLGTGLWIAIQFPRLSAYAGGRTGGLQAPSWWGIVSGTIGAFSGSLTAELANPWQAAIYGALLIAGAGVLFIRAYKLNQQSGFILTAAIAGSFLASFAANQFVPHFLPRYLLVLAGPIVICLAAALTFASGWSRTIAVASFVVLGLFSTMRAQSSSIVGQDNYRLAARLVAARSVPGEAVLLHAPWQRGAWEYYQQLALPVYQTPEESPGLERRIDDVVELARSRQSGVWMVEYGGGYDRGALERALTVAAVSAEDWYLNGIRLRRWSFRSGGPSNDGTPSGALFGDFLRLLATEMQPNVDGSLSVSWLWRMERGLAEDLAVSTKVLDGSGRLVAQIDRDPVFGARPTSTWRLGETVRDQLRLPLANAGPVQVMLSVYGRESDELLPVSGPGIKPGDSLEFGPITIPLVRPPG